MCTTISKDILALGVGSYNNIKDIQLFKFIIREKIDLIGQERANKSYIFIIVLKYNNDRARYREPGKTDES